MTSLFSRYRSSNSSNGNSGKDAKKREKEEPDAELTPLEKMLQNAPAVTRPDADKFFGLENFGNTCYCNSIVQALFYSETFRDCVINYPQALSADQPKVEITIRPPTIIPPPAPSKKNGATPQTALPIGLRPEDRPEAPEYKKKQAMLKGPILELTKEHANAYDMGECTFTGLKDIFLALMEAKNRTGVLSPQRFLEIFKRDNEMFRNSMHQDAHEFYGIVLNDIISDLEAHSRKLLEAAPSTNLTTQNLDQGLVRNTFEGLLSSETKCLTCETVSKKDETFLDLSIDLDEHSSVTSCLSKFSEEEVLCERNKFQCDQCGGLQEAEKRMKIQKLPKILALHLKRFKYTEDFTRLQKLQHRVVYPSHLRMFNTTPQTADPDRVYELYAVVVHIGGNAYHGHYVSVIKTKERGWLLFDDEMVEPVDDNYVNNFFGDENGLACAYVLFYQETTVENARVLEEDNSVIECDPEGPTMVSRQSIVTDRGQNDVPIIRRGSVQATGLEEPMPSLAHSHTAPLLGDSHGSAANGMASSMPMTSTLSPVIEGKKFEKKRLKEEKKQREQEVLEAHATGRERRKQEEKQRKIESEERRREREDLKKAMELSRKQSESEEKSRKGSSTGGGGLLDRASWSSKSMSRKSLAFLSKKREPEKEKEEPVAAAAAAAVSNGVPKPPSTSGTTTTSNTATTANGSDGHAVAASASMTSVATSSQSPVGSAPTPIATATATTAAKTTTTGPAPAAVVPEKSDFRSRFTFGLGKKKSTPALS
ncbi:hypothetical protein TD95_004489 [Thielaviopsis punctulata]|uniref:Ubiquitin carboxyl-terminal hydrolase n=1 Tax=Thielaviopsis punctulata TaxID=72032 RepID=A0A0F4Z9D8_9PEZI|nr:hypothetical protein TD95_004489 [Thielaviopsis punctulata]